LGLVAAIVAWRRRQSPEGERALVWAAAITAYVLFLHWRVQWHPYLFRCIVAGGAGRVVDGHAAAFVARGGLGGPRRGECAGICRGFVRHLSIRLAGH